MTFKKFVRAFVAGMAFPAVFLPLTYTVMYALKLHNMPQHPLQFVPMYIPLVFGLANTLFVRMTDGSPVQNTNVNLYVTGAILGFAVAVLGVFVLHIPARVFGFTHDMQFMPLIALPIIYALIFRFIIKWLNKAISV